MFLAIAIRTGAYCLLDAYRVELAGDVNSASEAIKKEISTRGGKYEGLVVNLTGGEVFSTREMKGQLEERSIAWTSPTDYANAQNAIEALTDALQKAVDQYGHPGGPWNVPSEPGTWIGEAKHALELAEKLKIQFDEHGLCERDYYTGITREG